MLFHHGEVRLLHLSSYSEAYTRALRMDSAGFFRDQVARARLRLGLVLHADEAAGDTRAEQVRQTGRQGPLRRQALLRGGESGDAARRLACRPWSPTFQALYNPLTMPA